MAKKPNPVAEAEAAVFAKEEEIAHAEAEVKRLQIELDDAIKAVRQARIDADASLPQCKIVAKTWRSGKEMTSLPAVILRRTPSGQIVARYVGDSDSKAHRFKWREHAGQYREKPQSTFGNTLELRDVPAKYMPTTKQESK